jgi:hypothetical protein
LKPKQWLTRKDPADLSQIAAYKEFLTERRKRIVARLNEYLESDAPEGPCPDGLLLPQTALRYFFDRFNRERRSISGSRC